MLPERVLANRVRGLELEQQQVVIRVAVVDVLVRHRDHDDERGQLALCVLEQVRVGQLVRCEDHTASRGSHRNCALRRNTGCSVTRASGGLLPPAGWQHQTTAGVNGHAPSRRRSGPELAHRARGCVLPVPDRVQRGARGLLDPLVDLSADPVHSVTDGSRTSSAAARVSPSLTVHVAAPPGKPSTL